MEQSESQPNKIKQSKPRPKKKGKKNETKQKKQKVATISVRFFFQRQVFFFSVNEKRGKKKSLLLQVEKRHKTLRCLLAAWALHT